MLGLFVSVPLPIFNRNQGEILRATAEHEKANRSLTAVETDVAGEVASAFEEFNSARELLIDAEVTPHTGAGQLRADWGEQFGAAPAQGSRLPRRV